MPVIAFTAQDLLGTLDRLAVDAVVASERLPADRPGDLVAGVRRRTAAPLVLLGDGDEFRHRADLQVHAGAPTETVARRVRGLLATRPPRTRTRVWGALRLDIAARRAWWEDVPLTLTTQQFVLLHHLVEARGGVVTAARLADAVYGQVGWHDGKRIRAHVLRLRRRLAVADETAATIVATIRGVGFRLREPAAADTGSAQRYRESGGAPR